HPCRYDARYTVCLLGSLKSIYEHRHFGGHRSNHQRAISSRPANQTLGKPFACSMNRATASARPGRPDTRECNPIDNILGCVSPSFFTISKLSFRLVRNWSRLLHAPRQYLPSLLSKAYGTTSQGFPFTSV